MYQLSCNPNWVMCNSGRLLVSPPKKAHTVIFNLMGYYGWGFGSSALYISTWHSKANTAYKYARTFVAVTGGHSLPPKHGQPGLLFCYNYGNNGPYEPGYLPMEPAQPGNWAQPALSGLEGALLNYPPFIPFIWVGKKDQYSAEPDQWQGLNGQQWQRAGKAAGIGVLTEQGTTNDQQALLLAITPLGISFDQHDQALHLYFSPTGKLL